MAADEDPELAGPLQRLSAGFPELPRAVVASILADAYILVVSVTGEPMVERAEELARLRLELRTGHLIGSVG